MALPPAQAQQPQGAPQAGSEEEAAMAALVAQRLARHRQKRAKRSVFMSMAAQGGGEDYF